jgi:hypothetical protein
LIISTNLTKNIRNYRPDLEAVKIEQMTAAQGDEESECEHGVHVNGSKRDSSSRETEDGNFTRLIVKTFKNFPDERNVSLLMPTGSSGSRSKRDQCLVIKNNSFDHEEEEERVGSTVDAIRFGDIFSQLGYEVEVFFSEPYARTYDGDRKKILRRSDMTLE